MKRLLVLTVAACGSHPPPDEPAQQRPEARTVRTVRTTSAPIGKLDGRQVRVVIAGDKIARFEPAPDHTPDIPGPVLWPPIIDSHVHVSIWPIADKLATTGIVAVVDLAAPERDLGATQPIKVIAAGPMLTRSDGYPLDSWGADGYGTGCADAACVEQTIDRVAGKGAKVIKLALGDNGLDPKLVPIAVARAHAKKLKVAAHALEDSTARLAGEAGVDVLAHTPVEPLSDATAAAWKGRACISTLAAFQSKAAVDNLRKLRAAGCLVLYGTDLGNLRDPGPSPFEVALLKQAGLDDAAVTAAMTTDPAKFWGLDTAIRTGSEASFLVLDRDPRTDAQALTEADGVWLRGRRVR